MKGCSIPVADQLRTISRLLPGWYNGQGERISSPTILAASAEISKRCPPGLTPYLYPSWDGGVVVEWEDASGMTRGFKVGPIGPLLTALQGKQVQTALKADDED